MRLRRAKNDRIDAALIAAGAALVEPPAIEPDARLAALADHPTFAEQIEEDIARLERRREGELRRRFIALERHADLKIRLELVLSVLGIGARTALAILIRLPELGSLSREQAAALPAAFRWNPAPIAFDRRLKARRKPHKAALLACPRKLLIHANTLVARATPWVIPSAASSWLLSLPR